MSCDRDDDNLGCGGGFPYEAMEWVRKNGIDTEDSYPYASGDGSYNKPPWGPPCEYPHKGAPTLSSPISIILYHIPAVVSMQRSTVCMLLGTRAKVNVTGHILVQAPKNSTIQGEEYVTIKYSDMSTASDGFNSR